MPLLFSWLGQPFLFLGPFGQVFRMVLIPALRGLTSQLPKHGRGPGMAGLGLVASRQTPTPAKLGHVLSN